MHIWGNNLDKNVENCTKIIHKTHIRDKNVDKVDFPGPHPSKDKNA